MLGSFRLHLCSNHGLGMMPSRGSYLMFPPSSLPPLLHLPPVAFTMSAVAVVAVGAVGATCDPGGGRTRGNIPGRVGPLVLRPSLREDTANSAPREVIALLISGEIIQRDLCPAYKLPL